MDITQLYKYNGKAIVDFKWKKFGLMYHMIIWGFFIIFMLIFSIAMSSEEIYIFACILGFVHLFFELKQIIFYGKKHFFDIINYLDLAAYIFPVITSFYWITGITPPVVLISFSTLLVDLKLISLFAYALYIYLRPIDSYSLDNPPSNINIKDQNNPWNLVTKYYTILTDGSISATPTIIQQPDTNTNMFTNFFTSILAVYDFLTG
ncbi:hypothetical protein C2G38_2222821 [Gigaspora rosea]|uniref:Ion transport domain-containing protein n=1 Tax=Gigaspora rosea TaxID=44941 RepID=A0A397U562_9GLOM|nr:hypothetical protein C2G38_2222821 [Gigaspora rosea]